MTSPTQVSHIRQTTKILIWNANDLLARKTELIKLMNAGRIDIAMISESHLKSSGSYHAEITNYTLYTCNHPSDIAHGGAALYVHKTMPHNEINPYSLSEYRQQV